MNKQTCLQRLARTLVTVTSGCVALTSAWAQARSTQYAYNSQHRLTTVSYNQQAATHYQYDASGNRTNQIVVGQANPKADYNANGLCDLWELTYFGNLLADPLADPDHDRMSNFAESRAWTDPTNPQSYFYLTTATNSPVGFTIRWEAQPNVTYRVWWTDDPTAWDATNSVVNSTGVFTDDTINTYRFYRLSVEP